VGAADARPYSAARGDAAPHGSRLRMTCVSVGRLVERESAGALALLAAVPFLFLHERYQPTAVLDVGSTSVDLRLSDAAVLLVLVAALVSAGRSSTGRLRPALFLWVTGGLLLGWLAFEALRPASLDDDLLADHLVSGAKLVEYALLAPAVPLLVRRVDDLVLVLGALVLWGAVASGVALAQFFGLDIFGAWNPGWRQPSFLGHHDLAAFAAIATSLAAAGILVTRRRLPAARVFGLALTAGVLGLVLAGSVAAAAGLALGALVLAATTRSRFAPSRRRLLALGAVVLVVAGGVVAIRGDALADFLRFVGVHGDERPVGVETYSQRTVLAYIGLRIFEDHPLIGVGWQRSGRPDSFEPYLADAHKRFPDVDELAFPSAEHPWGVQNLYVQMLADAGVVGLLLLLLVGAAGLVLAWRTVAYASTPWAVGAGLVTLCAFLTIAGEWASLGIVAGIPLQAAASLVLGLAAAGAATVEEETSG
jgi:O-antigen ligase